MQTPRLSFIIPYYKKAHTLKRCIQSLLNQSVAKQSEIIVVLDGPDSDALKILKKFAGKVKVLQLEANQGAPAARNKGLEEAKGEFVSFWDADSVIEPGAAAVWLQAFDRWPDVDFVYAGYMFEEGMGGVPGRIFDPYVLRVKNYISGHFPIKRSKCPKWDPSLKSLQDWDFWLSAVDAGCKGRWLKGYAFRTPYPDVDSISGKGCLPEVWLERLEAVKKKHNIAVRDLCVCSISYQDKGVELAKLLDADFDAHPNDKPNRYKTIVQVGFDIFHTNKYVEAFASAKDIKKILFWTGADIQRLYKSPYEAVEGVAGLLGEVVAVNFCEDIQSKTLLEKFGFKNVSILPLPVTYGDYKVDPLPEKPAILLDVADEYMEFFASVVRARPDVKFDYLTTSADVAKYNAMIRFQPDRCLTEEVKRTLLNGRRMISNTQAPFCGYLNDNQNLELMKKSIMEKVRKILGEVAPDEHAVSYYKKTLSPESFLTEMKSHLKEPTCEKA